MAGLPRRTLPEREATVAVDEKVLEEIQFHQDVIERDSKSPLFQIREKEIEISGRVLAAKKKAESVVADARRKAVERVTAAEVEGEALAKEYERSAVTEAEKQAGEIRGGVGAEMKTIEKAVESRKSKAVDAVIKAVVEV